MIDMGGQYLLEEPTAFEMDDIRKMIPRGKQTEDMYEITSLYKVCMKSAQTLGRTWQP